MARRKSNQRITKIKKDLVEELLKKAEATNVEDACIIQPVGSDMTPYPEMDNLRVWTHNYLLKGLTKLYPVKIDTDGQTFYTALIDGLPIYTKLTKSLTRSALGLQTWVNTFGNPAIKDGIASGLDNNNYFGLSITKVEYLKSDIYIECTLPSVLNSDVILLDIQGSNVVNGEPTYIQIYVSKDDGYLYVKFDNTNRIVSVDMDGVPLEVLGLSFIINFSSYNQGTDPCSVGFRLSNTSNRCIHGLKPSLETIKSVTIGKSSNTSSYTIDLTKSYLQNEGKLEGYFVDTIPGLETTKPGLWLSNLIQPISHSNSGGWLRHNLIHDNEDKFDSVNSDTLGHYAYTYTQSAIVFEGTLPEEQKYPQTGVGLPSWFDHSHSIDFRPIPESSNTFNLHWSPSILGCTAYPALSMQDESWDSFNYRFGNSYTTIQTLVVPANPDMQKYKLKESVYSEFQFIKNDTAANANVTWYALRCVGDDWAYELDFRPNGNGSGNDYGNGDNPENSNGSNGGCITGTIKYDVNGAECTQEVNYCFQTNQSYFNPNAPQVSDNAPEIPDIECYKVTGTLNACCYDIRFASGPDNGRLVNGSWVPHLKVKDVNDAQFKYWTGDVEGGGSVQFTSSVNEKIAFGWSTSATCGSSTHEPYPTYNASGYCHLLKATISGTIYNKKVEPEEGITLYLIIKDLKKQSQQLGLPWQDDCSNPRYDISISTSKCNESYCTNIVIAENVNINELGDISKFVNQHWKT